MTTMRLSLHFSISFIGFLILPNRRSKNNYFLYFKHTYLPLTGLPTKGRQPRKEMSNNNNYILFIKIFLRTNYIKNNFYCSRNFIITQTCPALTGAALKNAVRVERRVMCDMCLVFLINN